MVGGQVGPVSAIGCNITYEAEAFLQHRPMDDDDDDRSTTAAVCLDCLPPPPPAPKRLTWWPRFVYKLEAARQYGISQSLNIVQCKCL